MHYGGRVRQRRETYHRSGDEHPGPLCSCTGAQRGCSAAQARVEQADASLVLPQRIIVSGVKGDEIEAAISDFPVGTQRKIRKDIASGKYRLLWLTAWDWDTAEETGNTISILSDDYRRYVTLNGRRTRIAIPEPRSGYIEMRGEVTEDGNISISILSGTQPIALPRMSPGQAIRFQIDS